MKEDSNFANHNLPLIAVDQKNKNKVRPVMDFRWLNNFVESHSGDSHDCSVTLRNWRKLGDNLAILDLKKAYLQIHVDQSLQAFQRIEFD